MRSSRFSISGRMWSGLSGLLQHLDYFLFSHSVEDLLVCLDHCPVAWPNFGHAIAVIRMASHLTLEYFGIQRDSWSTQWLWGTQVLWLQKKPKLISPSPACLNFGMRCLCWKVFWLSPNVALCIIVKHLHFGHCSRSLMVFSDATFQNKLSCNVLFR